MIGARAGISGFAIVVAAACFLPAAAAAQRIEIPAARVLTQRNSALTSDAVMDIAVAPTGDIWVATDRGITLVGSDGSVRESPWAGRKFCSQVDFPAGGEPWVQCGPAGLHVRDGAAWAEVKLPAEGYSIADLAFDARGRPWVATNVGLFAQVDGSWRSVTLPHSGVLEWSAVGCLAAHPGGAVLAQVVEYGLVRIDPATFAVERVAAGTTGGCPLRVDGAGGTWFATKDGLYRLGPGEPGPATQAARVAGLRVLDIAFDRSNRTWVSTRLGGIQVHDGRTWTTVAPEQKRREKDPFGTLPLAFDRDGNLWTGGAVVHYFSKAEGTGLIRVPRSALPPAP